MTLIIIIFTTLISVSMFRAPLLFERFQLNPYLIVHKKEWHRILSHGFLHADWIHLIVNMIVLFSFGTELERKFREMEYAALLSYPNLWFLFMYLSAIVISSLLTIAKEKDHYSYNAVGASGAVSAVVFMAIFFSPIQKIYFYAIIPMPGILFGILYLIYSQYMSHKGKDNINHDAHFIGAVFGFLFPLFIEPSLWQYFISQIKNGL